MGNASDSASLPRGFQFPHEPGEIPRTPEASTLQGELKEPPAPAVPRLRVKRRTGSQIALPTEQFLASVAAADIALPTIEIVQSLDDENMVDQAFIGNRLAGFLSPDASDREASPPKTPIHQGSMEAETPSGHYRNWYMDSATPEDGINRPSSALSDPSDWSDDSYFSRISRPSEDGDCTTPESDGDPFGSFSKGKGSHVRNATSFTGRSNSRRATVWSKDMTNHLWQTYQVYLQDPTVTPFRIGASEVPPEGVIYRVAREAKRSWKGPKAAPTRLESRKRVSSMAVDASPYNIESPQSPDTVTGSKSGSITPTAEKVYNTYIPWQHSGGATRHHLRNLCRRKNSASVQRHRHLQEPTPTPFTNDRLSNKTRQRTLSMTTECSFATEDIALALATSSSQSMQPHAPLAKLSGSSAVSDARTFTTEITDVRYTLGLGISYHAEIQTRLGSPFGARTYGPSSSKPHGHFSESSAPLAQPHVVSGSAPRLRSPVRFHQSRSLNCTQKRRAHHAFGEEFRTNEAVARPSILDHQLFDCSFDNQRRVRSRGRSRGFSVGETSLRTQQSPLTALFANTASDPSATVRPAASLLPSAMADLPSTSSLAADSGNSNTFPRRVDGFSTLRRRAFATIHHPRRSIESLDFANRPSLQSHLSALDDKLAELQGSETAPSPFRKEED